MRSAFIRTITEIAAADPSVVLLTGDLGFMVMEPFGQRFPQRFINVGVAEQNMIGIATGLAESGFHPYAYSIASFASLRPFEFIRNGPVLHGLPVRIVGMGMGFEYGHAGPTHYAVEDIAVLRTLPRLTVVIPADSEQAAAAIRATAALPGPVYYSLGKNDRISVAGLNGRFELGRIQLIGEGRDVAILCMGSVSVEAVAAAQQLAAEDIRATVAIISNFNPDPAEDLAEFLSDCRCAVSVEAQTTSGGLASLVASVIASEGVHCRLRALGVRRSPDGTSGSQEERWRRHGLDRHSIQAAARAALGVSSQ